MPTLHPPGGAAEYALLKEGKHRQIHSRRMAEESMLAARMDTVELIDID